MDFCETTTWGPLQNIGRLRSLALVVGGFFDRLIRILRGVILALDDVLGEGKKSEPSVDESDSQSLLGGEGKLVGPSQLPIHLQRLHALS